MLVAREIVLDLRVRDRNTHQGIAGVNVYIPGLKTGATTRSSGRFILRLSDPPLQARVYFEHVGFDTLSMTIAALLKVKDVFLQERIIPLEAVEIESPEYQMDIRKDLPQTTAVLESRRFELKGYVDAGDLLKTDHSIQVDELISGKKTVAIRGGNPDEVVVLYDGIKLNSTLDNVFDMSLIDLEDISRFEIIKGSNTSLYGSEAFSGVINIVPKTRQDYKVRFQQRVGAYDSGSWGLHLYQNLGRLFGSYSLKKGGARRRYAGEPEGRRLLENLSEHHTGSLSYQFPGKSPRTLTAMYIRTNLDYTNERDNETLNNFNQLLSARFRGSLGGLQELNISTAYQWLDESQFLNFVNPEQENPRPNFLDRRIDNRSWHINVEKDIRHKAVELILAYQLRTSRLDFRDNRIFEGEPPLGLEAAQLRRTNQGLTAIGKYHAPANSEYMKSVDFNLSFRYDRVVDRQSEQVFRAASRDSTGYFGRRSWDETTFKFSTFLTGGKGVLAFFAFLNFGTNVKFPTLLQQISTPRTLASFVVDANLRPERNRSMELGFEVTREIRQDMGVFGWKISANFFRNLYENKLRVYYSLGLPVAIYDNVKTADISGFEAKPTVYLLQKKITLEVGLSKYTFSEQVTFPFRYGNKRTINLILDHAGYSLQMHVFKEGEQIALVRNFGGGLARVRLPDYSNMDLHFSKSVELNRVTFIFNASGRNVFNNDFRLEGLAIRDRRYYFSLGLQY